MYKGSVIIFGFFLLTCNCSPAFILLEFYDPIHLISFLNLTLILAAIFLFLTVQFAPNKQKVLLEDSKVVAQ